MFGISFRSGFDQFLNFLYYYDLHLSISHGYVAHKILGWSGGTRRWVNFQCRGVLLIWKIVGEGPTALAVDADGLGWTFFSLL